MITLLSRLRLETARANHKLATSSTPTPPKQSPAFWENFRSETAEINTYREILRTQVYTTLLSEIVLNPRTD